MKKLLLIIPVLMAVILVLSMQISVKPNGGMLSVTLSNKVIMEILINLFFINVFIIIFPFIMK